MLSSTSVQMHVVLEWCYSASPPGDFHGQTGHSKPIQVQKSPLPPSTGSHTDACVWSSVILIAGHVGKNTQSDEKPQEFSQLSITDKQGHSQLLQGNHLFPSVGVDCFTNKPTWRYRNWVVPKGMREERDGSLIGRLTSRWDSSICKDMPICSGINMTSCLISM